MLTASSEQSAALVAAGLLGLAASVVVRVSVSGQEGAASPVGGLVFALLLGGLASVAGVERARPSRLTGMRLAAGVAAGAVVCLGPWWHSVSGEGLAGDRPPLLWVAVVAAVAVAEEALLRGALWRACERWRGPSVALVVSALAFAGLHVPLYGWRIVPLDLVVGGFLGALRAWSGSWTAPAAAHVVADLGGWWVR